jgi:hypothetical protein
VGQRLEAGRIDFWAIILEYSSVYQHELSEEKKKRKWYNNCGTVDCLESLVYLVKGLVAKWQTRQI